MEQKKQRQIQIRTCQNGFMIFPVIGGDFIANTYDELFTYIKDIFEAPEPEATKEN